jgi:hypothetical protein
LLPLTLALALFIQYCSSHAGTVHTVLFISPPTLFTQHCLSRRWFSVPCGHHAGRHRDCCPLCSARGHRQGRRGAGRRCASRPPASSSRRSPRPPPWSRRLQLPVSACHRRLPRSWPHSSSPPPLQPTKTRSSPDFTFTRLQCSTSANW